MKAAEGWISSCEGRGGEHRSQATKPPFKVGFFVVLLFFLQLNMLKEKFCLKAAHLGEK